MRGTVVFTTATGDITDDTDVSDETLALAFALAASITVVAAGAPA